MNLTAALVEVPADDVSVDFPNRTIEGTVARYGVPANTSAGRIVIHPGDVEWSAPERVALLREHDRSGVALGHAEALASLPDRIVGRFRVAPGPDGDRALREAASGIRTGLSFGLDILANLGREGDAVRVRGQIREVSHVVVPAWDDARITATATLGDPSVTLPVPAPQQAPAPAPAQGSPFAFHLGHAQAAQSPAQQYAPAGWQQLGGAPVQTQTDHLTASIRDGFAQLMDELRRGVSPTHAVPADAPAPAGHPGAPGGELGLHAFASLVSQVAQGTGNVHELRAALADIVPADSPSAFRPQYLTELWETTTTPRKFIENATVGSRPLTSMKVVGQRWETPPEVGDYAGDKSPVPTNEPKLVDIPVTAKRLAGAHDVDRAYVDLGSPDWFEAYFAAQTESLRVKTDRAAALHVWSDAVLLPAAAPTLLDGVIESVVAMATLGEGVDYVAMSTGLVRAIFGLTAADAPALFSGAFSLSGKGDGSLGDLKWFTTPALGANQVIVGAKNATEYRETNPPVRVQALNIPNGGVDLGVFAYHAEWIKQHAAIRKFVVGQSAS